jgi:hypothetical protein
MGGCRDAVRRHRVGQRGELKSRTRSGGTTTGAPAFCLAETAPAAHGQDVVQHDYRRSLNRFLMAHDLLCPIRKVLSRVSPVECPGTTAMYQNRSPARPASSGDQRSMVSPPRHLESRRSGSLFLLRPVGRAEILSPPVLDPGPGGRQTFPVNGVPKVPIEGIAQAMVTRSSTTFSSAVVPPASWRRSSALVGIAGIHRAGDELSRFLTGWAQYHGVASCLMAAPVDRLPCPPPGRPAPRVERGRREAPPAQPEPAPSGSALRWRAPRRRPGRRRTVPAVGDGAAVARLQVAGAHQPGPRAWSEMLVTAAARRPIQPRGARPAQARYCWLEFDIRPDRRTEPASRSTRPPPP